MISWMNNILLNDCGYDRVYGQAFRAENFGILGAWCRVHSPSIRGREAVQRIVKLQKSDTSKSLGL